jgi:transcription initiation factor TFIIB
MVIFGNIFGSNMKRIPTDGSCTRMSQKGRVKDTNRIDHSDTPTDTTKSNAVQDALEKESKCPECNGNVVYAAEQAEIVCESCGLVLETDSIDRGPEWRAFTPSEREKRSRVGAPMTNLLHDRGLSTMIGWRDSDASGQSISPRQRKLMQRLRTWDERFRTKDAHERNLKQALGEIDRMASAFGLPDPVRQTAGVLYRRAVEDNLLPGRSIEGMATACLYGAARQQGSPRSLSEFSTVSRVDKLRIQRAYRYLSRELGLGIAPTKPSAYVRRFTSEIGLSQETQTVAIDLLETAAEQGVHSGKSPVGLAAAALYAASHLTNESVTQETVSEATQVSKVTIRNRYQELLEAQ